MIYRLLIIIVAAAFASAAAAQDYVAPEDLNAGDLEFAGESIELEMKKPGFHSYVEVDLGNGELVNFLIDTGASVNVIDSNLAHELGFEVVGQTEVGAPGGRQVEADIVQIPLVVADGLSIKNGDFVTIDFPAMSPGHMRGILGMGLWKEYLLTLDAGGEKAVISRSTLTAGQPGVINFEDTGGLVTIDITVGDQIIPAHLDTGATTEFTLPLELKDELPLAYAPQQAGQARVVGGPRSVSTAKLDGSISFAGLSYERPRVGFIDPSPPLALIGNMILDQLVLSIDQRNKLVSMQESAAGVQKIKSQRRLGIRFRGMPGGNVLNVAGVEPDSVAEKAGFKAGDVLLTLNGKATEEYEMADLGALFRSDEALRFEIDRDGTPTTIEID